ncbi:Uncharacterised protein [Mycobacterium tuberculosis]|uniref:Uncharacterized protein n=1 Tax=Mycobacterium tuberculosis TaxID=1773 RepID=A0A0T9CBD1_MYCTX|nr:Uncharacterised protein [Mycobacterium tuberculosis]CFR79001.1 Uncharacterised protein [Mycobacterium tuberculosis]CKQ85161.1 Uncharacterised protein [Mycobacterium tuberculosis]CKR53936.1 Uncharacterised protein [Mycobacterium tuberculosis]CKR64853.1 Uncharacterised protein [Mycobacterium tuberculosis]
MISPTVPADAVLCPMLLLADPSAQGVPAPYTRARLRYSIGSPIGVPVPCASTTPTVSGCTPAAANAARYTATWASSDGMVSVSVRPS